MEKAISIWDVVKGLFWVFNLWGFFMNLFWSHIKAIWGGHEIVMQGVSVCFCIMAVITYREAIKWWP